MSATLTIEVHDDGRVTMTGRHEKGGEVTTTEMGPIQPNRVAEVNILAGDDDTVTHRLMIGDIATIRAIEMLVKTGNRENGTIAICAEWAS